MVPAQLVSQPSSFILSVCCGQCRTYKKADLCTRATSIMSEYLKRVAAGSTVSAEGWLLSRCCCLKSLLMNIMNAQHSVIAEIRSCFLMSLGERIRTQVSFSPETVLIAWLSDSVVFPTSEIPNYLMQKAQSHQNRSTFPCQVTLPEEII